MSEPVSQIISGPPPFLIYLVKFANLAEMIDETAVQNLENLRQNVEGRERHWEMRCSHKHWWTRSFKGLEAIDYRFKRNLLVYYDWQHYQGIIQKPLPTLSHEEKRDRRRYYSFMRDHLVSPDDSDLPWWYRLWRWLMHCFKKSKSPLDIQHNPLDTKHWKYLKPKKRETGDIYFQRIKEIIGFRYSQLWAMQYEQLLSAYVDYTQDAYEAGQRLEFQLRMQRTLWIAQVITAIQRAGKKYNTYVHMNELLPIFEICENSCECHWQSEKNNQWAKLLLQSPNSERALVIRPTTIKKYLESRAETTANFSYILLFLIHQYQYVRRSIECIEWGIQYLGEMPQFFKDQQLCWFVSQQNQIKKMMGALNDLHKNINTFLHPDRQDIVHSFDKSIQDFLHQALQHWNSRVEWEKDLLFLLLKFIAQKSWPACYRDFQRVGTGAHWYWVSEDPNKLSLYGYLRRNIEEAQEQERLERTLSEARRLLTLVELRGAFIRIHQELIKLHTELINCTTKLMQIYIKLINVTTAFNELGRVYRAIAEKQLEVRLEAEKSVVTIENSCTEETLVRAQEVLMRAKKLKSCVEAEEIKIAYKKAEINSREEREIYRQKEEISNQEHDIIYKELEIAYMEERNVKEEIAWMEDEIAQKDGIVYEPEQTFWQKEEILCEKEEILHEKEKIIHKKEKMLREKEKVVQAKCYAEEAESQMKAAEFSAEEAKVHAAEAITYLEQVITHAEAARAQLSRGNPSFFTTPSPQISAEMADESLPGPSFRG